MPFLLCQKNLRFSSGAPRVGVVTVRLEVDEDPLSYGFLETMTVAMMLLVAQ